MELEAIFHTVEMRRRTLILVLLVALTGAGMSKAQTGTADLTTADKVVVASRIYSLIQLYFAHWEGVARKDVEAAYRRYVDDLAGASSRREFDLATMCFVAQLKNGHTQFFDSAMDGRPLKFRLLEVEKQWVVLGSQDSQLPRGAVVRSLNGIPVEDFVREQARYVAASNDRMARTHVFSTPGLFPEKISLTLADGKAVVIDRSIPGDARPRVLQAAEGRWLAEDRTAYIRIPSFGDSIYEKTAIELVRKFASAPNLVVDVRGNGGGTTPVQLIGALMNRVWHTWQGTTPQHVALQEASGLPLGPAERPSREQPAADDAYTGRVFVLVDRFCVSACEDFVMPFKETGRGTLIGETTQGSSGNPYRADLGTGMRIARPDSVNGMGIGIGAVRYRFRDGAPFEGIGIAPDVPVERHIADLVQGRDAVLERAQELANIAP